MKKSIPPLSSAQYLAGKIKRWHTCIGLEQTLADHSQGVAAVIALLHPNPSANLLKTALFHDYGELITGDIPSPAKKDPVLSKRLKELEAEGRASMGIPEWPLTEEERHWLALADAYETFMFLGYVGEGSPVVRNIEHQLVHDKINKHCDALGLMFDMNLVTGAPRNGERTN